MKAIKMTDSFRKLIRSSIRALINAGSREYKHQKAMILFPVRERSYKEGEQTYYCGLRHLIGLWGKSELLSVGWPVRERHRLENQSNPEDVQEIENIRGMLLRAIDIIVRSWKPVNFEVELKTGWGLGHFFIRIAARIEGRRYIMLAERKRYSDKRSSEIELELWRTVASEMMAAGMTHWWREWVRLGRESTSDETMAYLASYPLTPEECIERGAGDDYPVIPQS